MSHLCALVILLYYPMLTERITRCRNYIHQHLLCYKQSPKCDVTNILRKSWWWQCQMCDKKINRMADL